MKKYKKDLILKKVSHKRENKNTVSRKFKIDIINFFDNKYKDKVALEAACASGNTTYILGHLFKKVIAIDIDNNRIQRAKLLCNNLNNIKFKKFNQYTSKGWEFEKIDIFFIDCIHDSRHIIMDIENAINNNNKGIIIFDDYGLFLRLKKEIDNYIKKGKLKILKYIGEPKGTKFKKIGILKDYEGIICKINMGV